MFPPSFPSSVPYAGLPFPPQGPFGSVPLLHRYYGRLRPPAACPDELVVLARRYRRFPSPTGTAGSPRFLGVPLCGRCAHRPRPDLGTSRCGALVLPSPQTKALAPANNFVSRLHRAAPALPVYASRPGSPPHHATLGSRLVASLCRAGFVLLGPTEGFSQLHDILLLQASPGAPSGRNGSCQPGPGADSDRPGVAAAHHRRAPQRQPEAVPRDGDARVHGEARGRSRRALSLASRRKRGRDPGGRARPPPRAPRQAERARGEATARAAACEAGPRARPREASRVEARRGALPVARPRRRHLRLHPPG